ncbi:siderophore-iron reductase, Fe-S cluster protein [Thalassospira marina]|uniref:Siderophore-iron reductase, Fe-S cluster protein n=2 Tax=Thalassospira marina TaxID=2048283 RepID=A0A2N3KTV4_9PROT|nr:siderophore-iron reductase, Fe-S cluster protein [Thalassospira marina]
MPARNTMCRMVRIPPMMRPDTSAPNAAPSPAFKAQQALEALCGLQTLPGPLPENTRAAPDILDGDNCRKLLDALGPVIGSRSRKITASLLSKRIAFLFTAGGLYPVSMHDQAFDMSLDNCVVDYRHDGHRWQSALLLRTLDGISAPANDRDVWREQMCKTLFSGNLAPIWQALHEASGVSLSILWENTAVRIFSLYERRMMRETDTQKLSQIRADFDFLLHQADSSIFGTPKNPLGSFYFDKTKTGDVEIRYRRTCCYYYLTPPKEYCSTCPLLLKPRVKKHA